MNTIIKFKVQFIDFLAPVLMFFLSLLFLIIIIFINKENNILSTICCAVFFIDCVLFTFMFISKKVNPYIIIDNDTIGIKSNHFRKRKLFNLKNIKDFNIIKGTYTIEFKNDSKIVILKNELSDQEKVYIEKIFCEFNTNQL